MIIEFVFEPFIEFLFVYACQTDNPACKSVIEVTLGLRNSMEHKLKSVWNLFIVPSLSGN